MASTAVVRVTPICGARDEGAPVCVLLEIDEARILLDCGAYAGCVFGPQLDALRRLAPARTGGPGVEVDVVLLSHGDVAHAGGLPALLAAQAAPVVVLGTLPQHALALVALYDAYAAGEAAAGRPWARGPTLDAVDAAFERVTLLRYAQPHVVAGAGRAAGLSAVAHAAGRTLGGALWRVRRRGEDVVYVSGLCHRREAVLDGASLDALPRRPTLLLADAAGMLRAAETRAERDAALIAAVEAAVRAGGTALLPVEPAGRTLELLLVLERHWASTPALSGVPLVFASPQARRVLEHARGMLEWAGAALVRSFEETRANPFDVRHVRAATSVDEARAFPAPRVVLATGWAVDAFDVSGAGAGDTYTRGAESMGDAGASGAPDTPTIGGGIAVAIAGDIADDSNSAVVFTGESLPPRSLGDLRALRGRAVRLVTHELVPLAGDELAAHADAQRDAAEAAAAADAFAELQRLRDDAPGSDDSDGDDDTAGFAITSAAALRALCWTDYRRDWAEAPRLLAAARDPAHYPLLPPGAPADASGLPPRLQAFPHRALLLDPGAARAAAAALDDYGEPVDVRRDLGAVSEPAGSLDQPGDKTGTSPAAGAGQTQVPTKWVRVERAVAVACGVSAVRFDGLADGRSLRAIYGRVSARRVVFVSGGAAAASYAAGALRLCGASAAAPDDTHTLAVSSAANVVQAVLSEDAVAAMAARPLGEHEVAWLRVRAARPPAPGDAESRAPVLVPAPDAGARDRRAALLLGDVRLSDLRRAAAARLRMPAAFVAGDLVVGDEAAGRVAVRRDAATGRLLVEGPVCPAYYAVRALLYEATAFVGA